jgi:MFS family permease
MNADITYQRSYTLIFVFYYFIEGFLQGIPFLVWPSFIPYQLGQESYDIPKWLIIYSIGNIPWAIKMLVGIFNDRWGSKRFGRRFPWIASFGTFGGIWWFIMAIYMPTDDSIYLWLAIYYFMTQLGTAFSDTALDGLILDVTPKEKLGKVQGYTWTVMFLGYGAGGLLLGLIFMAIKAMQYLWIITGILAILSSIFPYIIKEPIIEKTRLREFGKDLLTIVTKVRNWKVFVFTFLSGIQGVMLGTFFNYLILIGIGVIDVQNTTLSIIQGTPVNLLGWNNILYFVSGIGIVIGSFVSGIMGDRSRKSTVSRVFLMFIPFCLILVVPFAITTNILIAFIFGFGFLVFLGALQNALMVVTQTLRGDLSKMYYPKLKSTYFALLVSLVNLGQNVGTFIGAALFTFFALFLANFNLIFYLIAAFCALTLLISYLAFLTIDSKDYELRIILGE